LDSNSLSIFREIKLLAKNLEKFIKKRKGKTILFKFLNNNEFYENVKILDFFKTYGT